MAIPALSRPLARLFSHLEAPAEAPPNWRRVLADFGPRYAANGFVGWMFGATAPVAVILSVGSTGGLSEAELAWCGRPNSG